MGWKLFSRKKDKPMNYQQAVKYLKNANFPSYMILNSLDEWGEITFKSIDSKVLEARKVVREKLIQELLTYKFKKQ